MVTKLGAVTKHRVLVKVTVFVSLLKAIRVFSGVRPSFITITKFLLKRVPTSTFLVT